MTEYFVTAEYAKPGGPIRQWSGLVAASSIGEAHEKTTKKLRGRSRFVRIFEMDVYPPPPKEE